MKFSTILATTAFIAVFLSCKKEDKTFINNEAETANTAIDLPDSIALKNYSIWQENRTYNEIGNRDTLVLAKLEKVRDTTFLMKFLTKHDSLNVFNYPVEKVLQQLYAIDINGDNKKDIIFEGSNGGEATVTYIYLNKGDHFEKVFDQFQYFSGASFKNNKLISFNIENPGCCADPQIINYHYTVTYNNDQPVFTLSKSTGYLEHTQKLLTKFTPQKKFTIVKDRAITRAECYNLDIEHPFYGEDGNAVAKFKKDDKGVALGSSNEDGKEWLYVLMSPTTAPNINPTFGEQPTHTYGWILKSETNLK